MYKHHNAIRYSTVPGSRLLIGCVCSYRQVDVYAFAMIAYELFEGRKPFGQIHPIEAARRASMDSARPQWGGVNRCAVRVGLVGISEDCCDPDASGECGFCPLARSRWGRIPEPVSVPECREQMFCRAARRRFGVTVPRELRQLVEDCWAPDFERCCFVSCSSPP